MKGLHASFSQKHSTKNSQIELFADILPRYAKKSNTPNLKNEMSYISKENELNLKKADPASPKQEITRKR